MTDRHAEDDEVVAAVVDREATAAEEARVAADPVLRARAAEFRTVADAVAAVPAEVDEGARDRAVRAALEAVTVQDDGAEVPEPLPRSWKTAVPRPILAAAAAVTLLAVGATVLSQLDSGGEDAAGVTESAAPELAPEPLDLGAVESSAEIRRQVVEATGLVPSAPAAESADSEPDAAIGSVAPPEAADADAGGEADQAGRLSEACEIAAVEANPDLVGLLAQGRAAYRGVDALVYVYNAAAGGDAVVVVVAADDCRGLDRFVL